MFVARVFNYLGAVLELHWLRDQIESLSRKEHWTRLARSALRDELYRLQRLLTIQAMASGTENIDPDVLVESWSSSNSSLLERYRRRFVEFKSARVDLALLNVALNELLKLSRDLEDKQGA